MDNRYLRDRAARRMRRRDSMDSRRGGSRSARRYDRYDYTKYDSMGHPVYMPQPSDYHYGGNYEHHGQPMYPTAYGVGHYIYGPDGSDYDDAKEYHKELEEWMHKLKAHDRFKLPKEEVIKKASSMGVRFHDFDEMEFYVTYLMLLSDFKQVANDPHHYIALAKEWLEDDDVQRRGSEKLCAYLYSIVLGKDDDD